MTTLGVAIVVFPGFRLLLLNDGYIPRLKCDLSGCGDGVVGEQVGSL
jgi:hypothetical protein